MVYLQEITGENMKPPPIFKPSTNCFGKRILVTFDLRSLACSLSSEQSAIKELATP